MAGKDSRFQAVQWMLHSRKGGIKKFDDIFEYIPKSTVAKELHMNNTRIQNLINYPLNLSLKEVDRLATLFGCTSDKLIKLIRRQTKNPGS